MKIKDFIDDFRTELTSYGLIVIILGTAVNLLLSFLNNYLRVNLWFDIIGSLVAAIISGPWTGFLTSLLTFTIRGVNNFSIIPYFLIGGINSLLIGYLHKYKSLISKKSNLIEILGTGSLIAFLSTIIYTKLNILLTSSASNILDWIIIILIGKPDNSMNGVLTGLVGPEMLAHFLDKTASLFITYFIIRILPEKYFKNKLIPVKKKTHFQQRRVIRAGKKITTIKKK
ncbi:MAG: ECF transporter S component [Nanoarchaeota archaeon]|nr:ECF transporter S component [Nanoarchaeota archaeon]